MDAVDFFLLRYETLHRTLLDDLLKGLTETQVRTRPHAGVNTIAWLIWHMARIEDVGVNRFVVDGAQVLDDGWRARLGIDRRVKRVCADEGAVAPGAEWLTEFWANRRARAWVLAQTPLLHVYGHYFEARVAAGLWGARSP